MDFTYLQMMANTYYQIKGFFLIFVLLCSCQEATIVPNKCLMTFSDALPVQFWLSGCDTYNQIEACGVHRACYCHEWQCDDHLVLQFTETDAETTYYLRGLDEDDNEVFTEEFASTEVLLSAYVEELSQGTNYGDGDETWATGSNPTVTGLTTTEVSKLFRVPIVNAKYGQTLEITIDLDFNNLGGSGGGFNCTPYFYLYSADMTQYVSYTEGDPGFPYYITATNKVHTITLQATGFIPAYFGYKLDYSVGGGFTMGADINSIEITDPLEYRTTYYFDFVPSQHEICDQKIKLQILSETSPETIVAKSDCLNIKETVSCSNLIEYYNNRNYAGLIYEDQSPDVIFYLRIKSVFFHERYPQQDKPVQISLGREISGTSTVKTQRRLDVDMMPYYMHRKLILALSHQNVTIDNKSWTKAEEYEIADGDRRWPMKKASVFLTENNSVRRNVL